MGSFIFVEFIVQNLASTELSTGIAFCEGLSICADENRQRLSYLMYSTPGGQYFYGAHTGRPPIFGSRFLDPVVGGF